MTYAGSGWKPKDRFDENWVHADKEFAELAKYRKALLLFSDDLELLGEVDESLAAFLIDETECFDDCPEIDRARQLVQAAYDIIKDYQTIQLMWVDEQKIEGYSSGGK
jgi:hypothetical protein|tara:strand:- start:3 stop:326 length:324 start_codon:yes stop_codon:yes gene_type:complete